MTFEKGDVIVTGCAIDIGTSAVPIGKVGIVQCIRGAMVYCNFDGYRQAVPCDVDELKLLATSDCLRPSFKIDNLEGFRQVLLADFLGRIRNDIENYNAAQNGSDKRVIKARLRLLRELVTFWKNMTISTGIHSA